MTAPALPFRPHRLRQMHLALLVRVMDAVQDALGRVEVRRAAERFFDQRFASAEELAEWLLERDAHSQFLPWLLWDARSRRGCLGRRLLPDSRLDRDQRALVAALEASPADAFRLAAVAGSHATLERLRDGSTLEVYEPVLATVAEPGEVMIARALSIDDPDGAIWLLDAVHLVVPAACARPLALAARGAAALPRERIQPALVEAALRALRRRRRRLRTLPHPDGEPLVRVSVQFDVGTASMVAPALATLVREGRLLDRRSSQWVVLDPTLGAVGAQLVWRGERLVATTRSVARADRLRRGLAAALPGLQPRLTLVRDLSALLDEELEDGADLARLTRDWLAEYLHGLAQRPMPALDGETPQQAMRTARGRQRVRAMLRRLEPLSQVGGPQCRATLASFWAELDASARHG